jgi:ankyrin repeat protein
MPTRRLTKEVFSLFKHKNSKPDPSEFLAAARANNVAKMQELLAAGAEVESKTSQNNNRTALHEAASLGHTAAAQFLIDKGAKKDAKTKSKSTPLHEAAWAGSTDVARLLIGAGAQKEARNLYDSTPLQLAAIQGHRDIVQILVDHGANVHTTRIAGVNPLEDAKTKGHHEVAQVLIRAGAAVRSRRTHREDAQETQWPGLF